MGIIGAYRGSVNGKDDKFMWLSTFFDPLSSDLCGFEHVMLVDICWSDFAWYSRDENYGKEECSTSKRDIWLHDPKMDSDTFWPYAFR